MSEVGTAWFRQGTALLTLEQQDSDVAQPS